MAVRGRDVARFLYLIFLLSLVCFENAQPGTDKRANLKEKIQKIEQTMEFLKANHQSEQSDISKVMNEYNRFMSSTMALMKKVAPEFHPLQAYIEQTKAFMRSVQSNIDDENEAFTAELENNELKLKVLKELLKSSKEHEDEFKSKIFSNASRA